VDPTTVIARSPCKIDKRSPGAESQFGVRQLAAALPYQCVLPLDKSGLDAFFSRKTKAAASRRNPRRLLPHERHMAVILGNYIKAYIRTS
jgi:hypothetical protein